VKRAMCPSLLDSDIEWNKEEERDRMRYFPALFPRAYPCHERSLECEIRTAYCQWQCVACAVKIRLTIHCTTNTDTTVTRLDSATGTLELALPGKVSWIFLLTCLNRRRKKNLFAVFSPLDPTGGIRGVLASFSFTGRPVPTVGYRINLEKSRLPQDV